MNKLIYSVILATLFFSTTAYKAQAMRLSTIGNEAEHYIADICSSNKASFVFENFASKIENIVAEDDVESVKRPKADRTLEQGREVLTRLKLEEKKISQAHGNKEVAELLKFADQLEEESEIIAASYLIESIWKAVKQYNPTEGMDGKHLKLGDHN